jgi:pilus assembly protein FimV
VAQHTGRLYDDDLTVGADEYSESFSTEFVDLFEPLGDDDAPIAKLKTIILSIDWEITDDILHQLNDELQDLKDVWAGNKINLVYIQALEKIGKYICAEKANAHPNAIKLLLAFYYDLEKIVSSVSMSEETKKQLLLQDVKKFEQFKLQIVPSAPQEKQSVPVAPIPETKNVLTPLKAIVLGIDWEISDKELVHLGEEVARLEKEFAESRAKLIFLQGIGALGSYIRSTKDKAHPDAFKLLHSFFEGLEKICVEDLSSAKEKEILLAEVSKFNAFKAVIAVVASEVVVSAEDSIPSASGREVHVDEEEEESEEGGVITPAFADMPEDVHGFDVDAEVVKSDIDQRVASFFGEDELAAEPVAAVLAVPPETMQEGGEVASRLDDLFGDDRAVEQFGQRAVASDIALEGVDVETEADDDSGEKALLFEGGQLAPALAEAGGESAGGDQFFGEAATVTDSSVAAPVIPGVDVETEADDESGEAPLPREQGWVAPALMFSDEGYGFRETELTADVYEDDFDLEDRLDSFFGAEIEESSQGVPAQIDDGEDTLPPALTAVEGLQPAAIEQPGASTLLATVEPLGLETQDRVDAGLLTEVQGVTPRVAGFIVEETGDQFSADVRGEERGVVFEPVADDVEVDELPAFPGIMGAGGLSVVEQEFLARLRECLAAMLEKKYYTELPAFLDEANTLIQIWQTQYVKMSFLQLLVTVCQYIDRVGADSETLALLQSLGESLELVFQGKTPTGEGKEKILFAEMGRVLCWQQSLILSVLAQNGRTGTDDAEVRS